jgi:hypothetical protein
VVIEFIEKATSPLEESCQPFLPDLRPTDMNEGVSLFHRLFDYSDN